MFELWNLSSLCSKLLRTPTCNSILCSTQCPILGLIRKIRGVCFWTIEVWVIDECYGYIWGLLSSLDCSNTFSFVNIFSSKHICNTRASSITKNHRALGLSLQRKYDVRTVKPLYKQYISIVASEDLKVKIEKNCAEKLFNNWIFVSTAKELKAAFGDGESLLLINLSSCI